jgi:hypothetical protein
MLRILIALFVVVAAASASAAPSQYGTAEEAKAMLDRAVAAVKQDKAKALDMFNEGEGGGGFKDRDLYVFCASASDGILTAHPTMKAQQLREFSERRATRLVKK